MAPSSSGLGRLVLIQKIAGSTPAGVTTLDLAFRGALFLFGGVGSSVRLSQESPFFVCQKARQDDGPWVVILVMTKE